MTDPDSHENPLAPARGCLNGILLGALIWAVLIVGFLLWRSL